MQITKSNRKQQQQDQKASNKMFKASMFRVSKWKLVVVAVAACLVAALIARCSSNRSEIETTKNQLNDRLKLVRNEQKLVREYVRKVLGGMARGSAESEAAAGRTGARPPSAASGQFEEHLFAKTVLNAFDRPYEHVVAAINRLQEELSRVGQPDGAQPGGAGKGPAGTGNGNNGNQQQQQHEETQRLLVEAYGRALEESQRHSVLIQEEIRRQQERVPNEEGRLSQTMANLRAWPLEQLAQFEARLIDGYLSEALREQPAA